MPTKVVVCDTPDGLSRLQYVLIKSGAALEIEAVSDGLKAVEASARLRPEFVVAGFGTEGLSGPELVRGGVLQQIARHPGLDRLGDRGS